MCSTQRLVASFVVSLVVMGCGGGAEDPADAGHAIDAFAISDDATSASDDAFVAAGEDAVSARDAPIASDAPPVDCRAIDEADDCVASACRWMTEGCGEFPQLWPAGCYPLADCDGPEDCAEGEACTLAIYRPYPPDENPDVCGLEGAICVDESL